MIQVDPSPILFYFFVFLFDPSRSELIRPGLAVRVDPVRLSYVPDKKCVIFFPLVHFYGDFMAILLSDGYCSTHLISGKQVKS